MAELLDCTLRDGSYAIDFAFTAPDTTDISRSLDGVGFKFIEVGHGIGIGAQDRGYGRACATDEEYMTHAHGSWGMFAIPGIAELDDIVKLAGHGASFVRIGCDVDKVETAAPFIEEARKRGLTVFSNVMKSYALDCDSFASVAKRLDSYGAEYVYIVDSSGSMTPSDIRQYIVSMKAAAVHAKIGFHGHNNLGLGTANAMTAIKCGCDIVDVTLCGIGRGGGNVPTEQLLAILAKGSGKWAHFDILRVMDIGERYIRPLVGRAMPTQLDIVSGMSMFHSSYMPKVLRAAKAKRIDPRALIMKLCSIEVVNVTDELVNSVADKLSKSPTRMEVNAYYGEEQG